MFVVAMLIFYIFIYKYFSSRKFSAVYILFGLLSANCSYIVIAAPGNWVRSEAFYPTRANLEFSLLNALYKTLHGCYEWLFQSPTFVLSIIMIPLVLKIVRNAEKSGTVLVRCSPLYVLGIILSLVYATFFMIFWSVGDAYWPVRTANFACLVFLMGWFYFAYMLIMYLNEKHPSILQFISKYSLPLVLLFSLIPLADFKNNNLYLAYSELLDGSAYTYNKEMYKRYADIENCKTDFCEVDPLTYHPKSLVFEDLTPNPFDYRNVYWAKYYNKKGVMIRWAPQRN
jgi:hypothetical protein